MLLGKFKTDCDGHQRIVVYRPAMVGPPGVDAGERGPAGDVGTGKRTTTPLLDALEHAGLTPGCAVDRWR